METIGEKHAFFEKRKCGSRKVLRFMRSLLYALTVLSLPMRGAWIEILWYNMVNEIAESYPLVRSRLPQNLKFEESRPKAVWGAFFIAQFYLLDMIVAIKIPKEIMSVNAS